MAKKILEDKLNKKEHNFKAKQAKQKAPTAFKAITAPSVPENVQETAPVKLKYRYYCEFCSNTGFTADYKAGGLVKKCQVCNKIIYTKVENYLLNN